MSSSHSVGRSPSARPLLCPSLCPPADGVHRSGGLSSSFDLWQGDEQRSVNRHSGGRGFAEDIKKLLRSIASQIEEVRGSLWMMSFTEALS